MKLPNSEHTRRPWRIHELTPDFRLEDVWALPVTGEREDFREFVDALASFDPEQQGPCAVRALFAARWKLGELFGWDGPDTGVGARVPTLRDRLPGDLRDASATAEPALPFAPLYLTDDEFAAEIANSTMHGVLHLGWVPAGEGRYQAQMAILVKPNGLLGAAYMAAIKPFRYLLVYPPMIREIGRIWQAHAAAARHVA